MRADKLKEQLEKLLSSGYNPEIKIGGKTGPTPLFLLQEKDNNDIAWLETVDDIDLGNEFEAQYEHIKEELQDEKLPDNVCFERTAKLMKELGVRLEDYQTEQYKNSFLAEDFDRLKKVYNN